jgi:hypothetical protein
MFLRNIGGILQNYTSLQPDFSYSPLSEQNLKSHIRNTCFLFLYILQGTRRSFQNKRYLNLHFS